MPMHIRNKPQQRVQSQHSQQLTSKKNLLQRISEPFRQITEEGSNNKTLIFIIIAILVLYYLNKNCGKSTEKQHLQYFFF
jgi:hypothetical protein